MARFQLSSLIAVEAIGVKNANGPNLSVPAIAVNNLTLERTTRIELASSAWKAEVLAVELRPQILVRHEGTWPGYPTTVERVNRVQINVAGRSRPPISQAGEGGR